MDVEETDASKRMAEVLDRNETDPASLQGAEVPSTADSASAPVSGVTNKAALGILESALTAAEDETDVAAARIVRAEAAAEMAEFDESAPLNANGDDTGENNIVEAEINKAEVELEQLQEQVGILNLFYFVCNFF